MLFMLCYLCYLCYIYVIYVIYVISCNVEVCNVLVLFLCMTHLQNSRSFGETVIIHFPERHTASILRHWQDAAFSPLMVKSQA